MAGNTQQQGNCRFTIRISPIGSAPGITTSMPALKHLATRRTNQNTALDPEGKPSIIRVAVSLVPQATTKNYYRDHYTGNTQKANSKQSLYTTARLSCFQILSGFFFVSL